MKFASEWMGLEPFFICLNINYYDIVVFAAQENQLQNCAR
jgi:hypothetical protein